MLELLDQPLIPALTYFYIINTALVVGVTSAAYLSLWRWGWDFVRSRRIQKSAISDKQKYTEVRYFLLSLAVFPLFGGLVIWGIYHMNMFSVLDIRSGYDIILAILQFVAMILLHDAYFYWTHRWMHHPKMFRFVHLIHHTSPNPNPFTSFSFDILESIINVAFLPIFVLILSLVFHAGYALPIFAFLLFYTVCNVYFHSGYELAPKWWLDATFTKYIVTPTHHGLHHEKNNGNYGFYFTFWDDLCGTTSPDYITSFRSITR